MASINGISLKNVREFKGHEGEPLQQGGIYYKGKIVGFWSQDSRGGICDNITLDYELPTELKTEINDILDNYESDTIFFGIDDLYREYYNANFPRKTYKGGTYLFNELQILMEQEKTYKKFTKQWGTNNIAICYKDFFNQVVIGDKDSADNLAKKIDMNKDIKLSYVYTCLKDFKIETPKK